MSNRVTLWVWDHSRSKGTDRLVLLAIARYTDDGGMDAWPSVPTIAEKVRKDARTVQRSLSALVGIGELRVHKNGGGPASAPKNRRSNSYTVVMSGVTPAPPQNQGSGVTSDAPRGDTRRDSGVTPAPPDLSLELSRRARSPRAIAQSIAELRRNL